MKPQNHVNKSQLKREHRQEQYNQLEKSLFDVAINSRESVLDVVSPHAGHLLKTYGYGRLMADYNEERRKVQFLKKKRDGL